MNADNMVGRTVAGYHLAEYIGEGGTATVYRAEHPERGRAAVKILRPRLAQDPIAVKRFLREAEYGARVSIPTSSRPTTTAPPTDCTTWRSSGPQGEPLAEFINRSGQVAPPLVATIVEQLGAALGGAHKAGIIHRDLKPANIMYDPATQTAKLLDFGIARDAELNPEERLTRAGFFVGTLQYVAPETLSGELVNEQADVYSLATIAYYLLTQELPFTGKSPRELFQQLLTQAPVPLNQAVKGLRFPGADRGGGHAWAGAGSDQAFQDGGRIRHGVVHGGTAGRGKARLPGLAVRQGRGVSDADQLRRLLLERSVRRGDFVLASGQRSSYYIDCRLTTMSAEGQVLIGRLGLAAIRRRAGGRAAIGGLTMGADPVAYAIAAASWGTARGHRRLQRAEGSEGPRHWAS